MNRRTTYKSFLMILQCISMSWNWSGHVKQPIWGLGSSRDVSQTFKWPKTVKPNNYENLTTCNFFAVCNGLTFCLVGWDGRLKVPIGRLITITKRCIRSVFSPLNVLVIKSQFRVIRRIYIDAVNPFRRMAIVSDKLQPSYSPLQSTLYVTSFGVFTVQYL